MYCLAGSRVVCLAGITPIASGLRTNGDGNGLARIGWLRTPISVQRVRFAGTATPGAQGNANSVRGERVDPNSSGGGAELDTEAHPRGYPMSPQVCPDLTSTSSGTASDIAFGINSMTISRI